MSLPMPQERERNQTKVSLAFEEREFNVGDEIALRELELRIVTAKQILKLFTVANGFVLGFLVILLIADWILIAVGTAGADQRIVTEKVLMALLGATTVQVGAIMFSGIEG